MTVRFAERMINVKPSAIRELLQLGADPSIISFGGGYPDASLFPLPELNEVFKVAIIDQGRESLQYTVSNGTPKLRAQVAGRLAADGIICGADNVLILQGGQQGLDLVAKMLINKGDLIIVEDPTFLGALAAFNPYEPRYATVPMDQDGMDMNALEETLKANPDAKFIYTIPEFQNPTGVTMSLDRRKVLIELANRYDVIILEDTPYREIRFEGEPIAAIKSLDTEDRVIYLGSFSKILAPGLRLGWAVASEDLVQRLTLLKLGADTQCSTLNMAAVSLFLENYDIDQHIVSIRKTYLRKKNLILDTIRATFPQEVSFTEPSGGMFTWLTFAEGFDAGRFMKERALPEAKVAYVPGAPFFAVRPEPNHARVSYSTQTDEAIVEGMTRLGKLLKAAAANTRTA
ncbi:PLP-dependent aminotransferase family protein [Rhizobium sp. B230/85]|uniref:aminotransferase-like domain-containing protein n=1 Tax=unclassified Rhizobium TaxID=2613769 RepID=UPI001ADD06E2|nr:MULTISPECIES: PLP-dependent aminotransferase family protein [unclassified Rhizobium]MBO9136445.1 PLP-dependent aminotransferase family protein [Rhizobium sp. B209b/85]QXZ98646.1 PLP-dependent aminotransferase family protein [Rhizobium sp. B230/85]